MKSIVARNAPECQRKNEVAQTGIQAFRLSTSAIDQCLWIEDAIGRVRYLQHFGDVMHPNNVGAAEDAGGDRSGRGPQPLAGWNTGLVGPTGQSFPQEPFA